MDWNAWMMTRRPLMYFMPRFPLLTTPLGNLAYYYYCYWCYFYYHHHYRFWFCFNSPFFQTGSTPCPEKNTPKHYQLSLEEKMSNYNNFWYEYFWHSWSSNDRLHNVCFCTTWGKQNQRNMSWNEQKYIKKHPQHYQLWLEKELTDFTNFWCKHFWYYFPSNGRSRSHIAECLFLHYLGKPEQAESDKNAIFCWFCFSR